MADLLNRCLALTLLSVLAGSANAIVPPEVPSLRTSQIYSPLAFDIGNMGRSVFLTGGVYAQGYEVAEQCVVSAGPQNSASVPSCGLDELLSMLGSPAGILHLETHSSLPTAEGGRGGSVFMVEVYKYDQNVPEDPCHAVNDYLESLIPNVVQEDEMQVVREGTLCILRAEPIFVTRHLLANHGIVHGMMCEGADLWPVWIDQHRVRNYVSHGDSVYLTGTLFGFFFSNGLDRTQLVFENMAGIRSEAVGFGNRSISQSVAAANANLIGDIQLHSDSAGPPNAAQMRLYNAPRIVLSALDEDIADDSTFSNQVYRFTIGSDQYPYNPGSVTDYPSGGVIETGVYQGHALQLRLRFSEPMNPAFSGFNASILFANGTSLSFTPVGGQNGWTNANLPNPQNFDTWTGQASLPVNAPEGRATIKIRASRIIIPPALDDQNQAIDSTGSGNAQLGSEDSSISFFISDPRLVFFDGASVIPRGVTGATSVKIQTNEISGASRQLIISGVRGDNSFASFELPSDFNEVTIPADTPGLTLDDGDVFRVAVIANGQELVSRNLYIDRSHPELSLLQADAGPSGVVGPFTGNQTSTIWLNNKLTDGFIEGIEFVPADDQGGVAKFKVEKISGPEYWDQTYDPGTGGAIIAIAALPDCPVTGPPEAGGPLPCEGTYRSSVQDHVGLETSKSFKVDSFPPRVEEFRLLSAVGLDAASKPAGLGLSMRAVYKDAGSGVYNALATLDDVVPQLPRDEERPDGEHSPELTIPLISSGSNPALNSNFFVVSRDVSGNRQSTLVVSNYFVQNDQGLVEGQMSPNVWYAFGGSLAPADTMGSILRGLTSETVGGPGGEVEPGFLKVYVRSGPRVNTAAGDATAEYEGNPTVAEKLVFHAVNGEPPAQACTDCPLALGPHAEFRYETSGVPPVVRYSYTMLNATGHKSYPMLSLAEGIGVRSNLSGIEVEFANVLPGPDNRIGVINGITAIPPPGYRAVPGAAGKGFDVFTTAHYTGKVKVTVKPERPELADFPFAGFARLFHMENGVWVDRTTTYDPIRGLTSEQDSTSPFAVFISTSVLPPDETPPATTLSFDGANASAEGAAAYTAPSTFLRLNATDGDSGVDKIYYAVDPSTQLLASGLTPATVSSFQQYTGSVVLTAGRRVLAFGAVDNAGNYETLKSTDVLVDATVPTAQVGITGTIATITADDPVVDGFASGLDSIVYLVDVSPESCDGIEENPLAAPGTCANPVYQGPFTLTTGTHTIHFTGIDRVHNGEEAISSTNVLVAAGAFIIPSTGPVGIPFTISGTGFGTYAGANTLVKFGVSTAPISVWNDTTIQGTVPGLSTGSYAVYVERQAGSTTTTLASLSFGVTAPSITTITPSSGPIGTSYTLAGTSFGPYAGANTRVLIGGATTPISVWNDATIVGTVPGALSPGTHPMIVERLASGGFSSQSSPAEFTVAALSLNVLIPSTGPIAVPFTIAGSGFGAYGGANTRVRFGVSTAAISIWNDSQIVGTVPSISTGDYSVVVERQQGTGIAASNPATFTVTALSIASVTPSSGAIGASFTLSGTNFGPYAGANTQVLISGATTPISVWNDSTITGTVPGGLAPGNYTLIARRRGTNGFVSDSNEVAFEVTGMTIASLTPSTGPIGISFTITGSHFGAYGGANTRVRFGASTAAISVWNDTTVTGTVPPLSTGTVDVVLERQQGASIAYSTISSFTVTALDFSVSPTSGPIGVSFTLSGSDFGAYGGANTRLLLGGTTAAVSVWNDTTITGTVPPVPPGSQPLWIERKSGTGVQSSATAYFLVLTPEVATLTPSSAPIGAPFTITGTNFGTYGGANTRVKFGSISAPISVWNNFTITGTVPGAASPGATEVVVERVSGSGLSQSATQAFLVLVPTISTITPSYGPATTVVTVSGYGFGPYAGTNTKLLVGGSTVAVSVWNDTTIRWTVPASLSDGDYPVVVRRTPSGGTVDSASATFTVGTGFGGMSFGFGASQPLAVQPDQNFEGLLSVSAAEGGRVETPAKAAVELPPNAMDEDTEISVKRLRADGLRAQAAETARMKAAGEAIEFGPDGTRFNSPVWIELPYDPALTPDESKVSVHYYDPLRRAWDALPSVVDRARKVVRAQTDHFSIYQPMAIGVTTAAQDEFYLREHYAFPNPVRSGVVTFRVLPGMADTIEVRVYDVAGRKVYSSTDFMHTAPGGEHQYDHAWNISGIGSGVYTYAIKASRSGQRTISKTGKVGVVK